MRIKNDKDQSKEVSPNNITSNTNNKTNDYNSPQQSNKGKINQLFFESKKEKVLQSYLAFSSILHTNESKAKKESFETKEITNNNQSNDKLVFENLNNVKFQNKSRNQQINNLVKINNFNSEKTPSYQSITLTQQKNTREKNAKHSVIQRSTFENKTMHKVIKNQKFNSNFTLNFCKNQIKKQEMYNNNNNSFLTKIDNATKINFRLNNNNNKLLGMLYINNLEKNTAIIANFYTKIEVKKKIASTKQTDNKSLSKDKLSRLKIKGQVKKFKVIHNQTNIKNNSSDLKNNDYISKNKINLIVDLLYEKNRKLSYDNKSKPYTKN